MSSNSKKDNSTALRGGDIVSEFSASKSNISDAVPSKPLEVKVQAGNFERAFRFFRTMVQHENVLAEYKERQSYEKPSEKKRRKRRERIREIYIENLKSEKDKDRNIDRE